MRAGLKRGFTPPQITLEGRDASIRSTADAASDPARPRGVGPECMLHLLQLVESFQTHD